MWDAGNVGGWYSFVGNGPASGLDPSGTDIDPVSTAIAVYGVEGAAAAGLMNSTTAIGLVHSAFGGTSLTIAGGSAGATSAAAAAAGAALVAGAVVVGSAVVVGVAYVAIDPGEGNRVADEYLQRNDELRWQLRDLRNREGDGNVKALGTIFKREVGRAPNAAEVAAFLDALANGASLGSALAQASALANAPDCEESAGEDSSDDDEWLYRGVPTQSPQAQEALASGDLEPPNPGRVSEDDLVAHWHGDTDTGFTSWSRDPSFAEEMGMMARAEYYPTSGVTVFRVRESTLTNPKFDGSPYSEEFEVTIQGTVSGVTVYDP